MVEQCKLSFIHSNENLYKDMFLLLLSCWELLGGCVILL